MALVLQRKSRLVVLIAVPDRDPSDLQRQRTTPNHEGPITRIWKAYWFMSAVS